MREVHGTLIFADGVRMAGLTVRLDEYFGDWRGSFLIPPELQSTLIEAFRQTTHCAVLLDDGRSGMITLTALGAVTRFEGIGALESVQTREASQLHDAGEDTSLTNATEREHICGGCGSVYVLRSETGGHDRGSIDCTVCGRIVIRWNGSTRYEARLVKQGTPKRKA